MRSGIKGELEVAALLTHLPSDEYITLNDITIKDEYGTHQIDHIVISRYGIFVIETKEYHGVIKGDEFDKEWVQFTFTDKNYVINPIRQNYGHIKALSKCLNMPEDMFINIICLTSAYDVDVNNKGELTRIFTLLDKIKYYNEVKINDNVFEIKNKILTNNYNVTTSDKMNHSQFVRNKELEGKYRCPKCGSMLIKRKGPYSEFLGCSNYPKCKYIKK
jgi:hypothetical protein